MHRVLLVDNEASILSVLSTLLKAEGYEVRSVREAEKARELLKTEEFHLLISDIRMEPVNGMTLLKWVRAECPDMSVIMLTAYASVETAIAAMKLGAFDYVTKPFKVDELVITIQRALQYKDALAENKDLKARLTTKYRFENIVADSDSMKNVCEIIERVAPTDSTIMIYGESGTGKELVAKALHAYSNRRHLKFLAVNCAALPEPLLESEMFGHMKGSFTGASSNKKGLFEAAEGGTIFLDEIGSMPIGIQGKLLRVLQEKEIRRVGGNENIPIDVRVLASTNVPLEELMAGGTFREDLYYRLNVIPLTIEPLRDRKEDILPLANHILRKEVGETAPVPEITPQVSQILRRHSWPGNVRELENAIKHALTFARDNRITADVLPPAIINAVGDTDSSEGDATGEFTFKSLRDFLRDKEQEYLEEVLAIVDGDKERAASSLRISLATLYRKLAKEEKPKEDTTQSNDENDPNVSTTSTPAE